MPCLAKWRAARARTAPVVAHSVVQHRSSLLTGTAEVIPFPAHRLPRLEIGRAGRAGSEFRGIRKYAPPESHADYRQRMLENVFATVVAIVLIVTGGWMLNALVSSWPG
jgi:hypothetical protein